MNKEQAEMICLKKNSVIHNELSSSLIFNFPFHRCDFKVWIQKDDFDAEEIFFYVTCSKIQFFRIFLFFVKKSTPQFNQYLRITTSNSQISHSLEYATKFNTFCF